MSRLGFESGSNGEAAVPFLCDIAFLPSKRVSVMSSLANPYIAHYVYTHSKVIVQLLKLRLELRIAFTCSHGSGTFGGGARAKDVWSRV